MEICFMENTEKFMSVACAGAEMHRAPGAAGAEVLRPPGNVLLSAVRDGRRHGHLPEMWQFKKLDVREKLLALKVAVSALSSREDVKKASMWK
jgi:hypothetical protein